MKISKRELTQREIINAAKNIIYEMGYESVTVRRLAEVTGYSHTNLYYYFKDLNSLLWDLRLDMIEDMIVEFTKLPFTSDDPIEEILSIFKYYIDYFFKHPNVFRFFYFYPFVQPNGDESYEKLDKRFKKMWKASFYRLVKEGIIEAADIEVVSKTIIFSIQGMIMMSFSSNGLRKQDSINDELTKLVNYLFSNNK